MRRSLISGVIAGLLVWASLAWPAAAGALELVMLERPGCAWCRRFDAEIAPAYPLTAEGARAPLRRVDVTGSWPGDLAGVRRERFTPTFVLVHEGVEVDRLRGYPGDEFFWFLLGEMLSRLPDPSPGGGVRKD
ncbi:transcriptional regulator [Minwuia thermotolerans]|uniref:Transcriptional regulator n=1 Tax=Minwuia thermotolerans TaxID=2056226 RepID=A0A2M9G3N7_9PROT|nr:transcriptional regulator [Minwuia thermotolerans]